MKNSVAYTIVPKDLAGHLFEVSVTLAAPAPEGQVFSLPAWIPGSYMIREFSRNIVQIRATANGKKVALKKLDKHTWQAAPCAGALTLLYEVYAWDLSVRAAHLDQTHGFFNGTSVFLQAHGHEHVPHVVDIQAPTGLKWRVATTLPELKARRHGFGTYAAANYDELIDHPVEMGTFELGGFKAHGVPHEVVFTGRIPNLDMARVTADLQKICEAQIALFEPKTKRAPMERYVFMAMVTADGYGGLEHRASTALMCAREDLPVKGKPADSEGYRNFLGLCSHEYFHTWNVKRIKPAAFAPYDLRQETHTPLLWVFEGFTSYYDDLMLVRSGVIDEAAYFKAVAKTVNTVLRGAGRRKQSIAESSFDAWTKYYRQDENSPNAIVSYYTKGSLVALALDLTIRSETQGRKSLDDVMRALWQRYGRDFYAPKGGRGITEAELEALIDEVSGLKLKSRLDRWVRGTADLPLADLLAPYGIDVALPGKEAKPGLGVRAAREGNDCKLATVYEGQAAHKAGLSGGDVLVALDGLRVTASNLDKLLERYRIGDSVTLHAFRRDELLSFSAELTADDMPKWEMAPGKQAGAVRRRKAWLG
ncbi:MAG: M61 family metallopeptidase [Burkholderiaceae bacterium]|nr:M61 family metallopeptidase [Burkholderiaceae bacterium]